MKTIKIKVPDGKKAEWVDGILTLVDEPPVEFKFRAGDKVIVKSTGNKPYTITFTRVENGKVYYYFKDEEGVPYCNYSESDLEPYVEPQNITERIKTFEDACEWCKANNKEDLVWQWIGFDTLLDVDESYGCSADILAYLKLRIITTALNEGWEPKDENKYYAFWGGERDVEGGHIHYGIYVTNSAVKLAFKSEELAIYAINQFMDIYMDFCGDK